MGAPSKGTLLHVPVQNGFGESQIQIDQNLGDIGAPTDCPRKGPCFDPDNKPSVEPFGEPRFVPRIGPTVPIVERPSNGPNFTPFLVSFA